MEDLLRPQNSVKHSVSEHLAHKSQRNSGGDPAAPASAGQRRGVHPTPCKGKWQENHWLMTIGWRQLADDNLVGDWLVTIGWFLNNWLLTMGGNWFLNKWLLTIGGNWLMTIGG